jgi:hypothetical protein
MTDDEFNQWFTGFTDASKKKALVVWGTNLESTVGSGRFTKLVSNVIKIAPYQYSVIVGLLLSDGWLTFASKTNKSARLGFAQSGDHSKYLWFVFFSLAHYCSSSPTIRNRTRFDKQTIELQFLTRSLPCFTELHSLFYSNGVKLIPDNIYNLLSPVVLAHWIMGDGVPYKSGGISLCTDSYSAALWAAVRLINVLIIRYDLKCTIHTHRPGQYRIHISKKSVESLKIIVIPHMIPSMLYKIHL